MVCVIAVLELDRSCSLQYLAQPVMEVQEFLLKNASAAPALDTCRQARLAATNATEKASTQRLAKSAVVTARSD